MDSVKRNQKIFGSSEFISGGFINKPKKAKKPLREFSSFEEILHAITHGSGAALAVVGTILLILKAAGSAAIDVLSATIFGASLIILYCASCAYHTSCALYPESVPSKARELTKKFDHCCIFILITGTYAPACLSSLGGALGWTIFAVVGGSCTFGFVLNCIDVERFRKISLFLYIIAGWAIVLASVPYSKAIGMTGFSFLVLGGILYTLGVVFYKIQSVRYFHVLWHLFVLSGSIMHYLMIYLYCF